jgi:hypothetical protein
MTDKIKTYVITSPDHTNLSWSLGPTGLTGYDGFFYSIAGPGGVGGTYSPANAVYAGSGGFIQSGYVDLTYPYNVNNIQVSVNTNDATFLSIGYTGPNIDPTNGAHHYILTADKGQLYNQYPNMSGDTTNSRVVCGFYASGNNFDSSGNPILINQRNVDSSSIGNPNFTGGPQGALSSTLGKENFPTLRAGGGFYAGGTGIFGVTGPFGFNAGGYIITDSSGNNIISTQSITSTGYAIISLIPTSMTSTSSFLDIAGSTGTYTGNTGLYLYSLLGGGGGGGYGGGGAGVYECGFLNSNTGIINYSIGSGGIALALNQPSIDGNGGDSFLTLSEEPLFSYTAPGGNGGATAVSSGGDGFFTGGYSSIAFVRKANSYINMPSNNSLSQDGAGGVLGYGQAGVGAGGGGPYGGNSFDVGPGAAGYGCGGGTPGGGQGEGTGGYIILRNISSPNIKFYKITSNTTFDFLSLFPYTGFWFFLSTNGLGTTSFDTGHFLVKEDNVREISITTDGSRFTIKVNFGNLYNQPQQYSLTSSGIQNHINIFFYS